MKSTINQKGFSLLELIVVLAGLGILSSLALPNFMRVLDFNNIDAVKALLNSAAADCLQNSRLSDKTQREKINEAIISPINLKQYGYQIISGSDTCVSFEIEAITKDKNNVRFPIGFSITDGKLTKFATPNSDASLNSCQKWAGTLCKENKELKELINHKKAVAAAKDRCTTKYNNFLKNPGYGKTERWDNAADSGCPSTPTSGYKTSGACTTNGCRQNAWVLDGEAYGREEDFKAAEERKLGKQCTEKIEKNYEAKGYTNPSTLKKTKPLEISVQPLKVTECRDKEYWLFNGEKMGDKLNWEEKYHLKALTSEATKFSDGSIRYLCVGEDQKTEAAMKKCEDDNASDICENKVNQKKGEKFSGQFIADAGGPGVCSVEYWLCEGVQKTDEDAFKASSCGEKACPAPPYSFCPTRKWHYKCRAWAALPGC